MGYLWSYYRSSSFREVFLMVMGRAQMSKQVTKSPGKRKWSAKRKRKIDCARPRGFSEKAHCASKKRRGRKR